MTLVVALRHRTGVVLASDSQATMGTSGQPTKQLATKLRKYGKRFGMGCSGAQGSIQELEAALESHVHELARGLDKGPPIEAKKRIDGILWDVQKRMSERHIPTRAGQQNEALVSALLVGFRGGEPFIYEAAANGSNQFHEAPYAAIGSGDVFAVHALKSVEHFHVNELSEEWALMLAYRTISDAFGAAAFYIGPPVQLLRVRESEAHCLSPSEVTVVGELVDVWKRREAEILAETMRRDTAPVPEADVPAFEADTPADAVKELIDESADGPTKDGTTT